MSREADGRTLLTIMPPFWLKPRLHDTICCQTGCQTGCDNRFDNRIDNGFDNRLYRVYKHSTGCQTRLTTGLTKRLYRWQPVERTVAVRSTRLSNRVCQTGLTNTIWQPVERTRLSNRLSNPFDNRFDNRLDVCSRKRGLRTICVLLLKVKFHYAIWSQTGPKLGGYSLTHVVRTIRLPVYDR